jgi:uncharacterized membrane protein
MALDSQARPSRSETAVVGRALGVVSAALGVPLVARPTDVTDAIGVGRKSRARLAAQIVGGRELAAAAALLVRPSAPFVWARVAGDAMDLTLLGRALAGHGRRHRNRTVAATAAVAGLTAVDVVAALRASRSESLVDLTASTTIRKSPQEVYERWRAFSNLPEFMAHLERVDVLDDRRSHWVATAPFGSVEWDATITEDAPGERIAWRSDEGATVPNEGVVRFVDAPGDRGTEVHVEMRYSIPGGSLGKLVARYLGEEPHQQLDDDLRRFKQVVEIGEVVRSDGAPAGKRARKEFPQRPAQPLSSDEYTEVTR